MKANDFVMREVTFESKESYEGCDIKPPRVTRTRTSSGFASITASVGGITFSFDNGEGNDGYEQQAREFAALIVAAADDRCELPKEPLS